jgi:hypothetical protein
MPIQISQAAVDAVYDYWKDSGFPHYPTDYSWRKKHFTKLIRFDRSTLFKPKEQMIGQSTHGLSLAWSYMPHFWNIKCGYMKTPISVWESEEHLKKGIRKMLDGTFWKQKEYHNITASDIRSILRRYAGTQSVSNFRPTAAAVIYDKFLEKASPLFGGKAGTTWDMSCGYGGRLLGAIAADVNYIGTDPCEKTFVGLEEIKKDWAGLNRTVEIHQLGSEEFRPDKNSVDLCFTSPPYFDWEKYSEEETQSYKKYPTKEEWIEGFLRQTIENCYYGLKKGGVLIMNVANTKRIKNFETETTRLAMQAGFTYKDCWYLQLASQEGVHKVEPIFIFEK